MNDPGQCIRYLEPEQVTQGQPFFYMAFACCSNVTVSEKNVLSNFLR